MSYLRSPFIVFPVTLAIEPRPAKTMPTSHSAFSMADDDSSNDTNQLFSLLPSFNSTEKIIVHNRPLAALSQIFTDKTADCVAQWYRSRSVPDLLTLIKRGLVKVHKERSIRMTTSSVSVSLPILAALNTVITCRKRTCAASWTRTVTFSAPWTIARSIPSSSSTKHTNRAASETKHSRLSTNQCAGTSSPSTAFCSNTPKRCKTRRLLMLYSLTSIVI